MTELSLFDYARTSDPDTSKRAAGNVHQLNGLKAVIYELLDGLPGGANRAELQALLERRTGRRIERGTISRRMTDLRAEGLVAVVAERDGMGVFVTDRWAPRYGDAS